MTNYPFQATIVGKDTIPGNPRKPKWGFLKSMFEGLNPGQAIRLVFPKGKIISPQMAWGRIAKKKGATGHIRLIKQADGSRIAYLWYGE